MEPPHFAHRSEGGRHPWQVPVPTY